MSGVQRLAQCTLKMLAKISYKKLGSMKKENSETVFIQKIGSTKHYKTTQDILTFLNKETFRVSKQ